MGWLTELLGAFGKVINALPIQGRIERLKNELDNLEAEHGRILSQPPTKKSAERIVAIVSRIAEINRTLKNYAKD